MKWLDGAEKQRYTVLRLYEPSEGNLPALTFNPLKISDIPGWEPRPEDWSCCSEPLRVYFKDYERLLKSCFALMFPTIAIHENNVTVLIKVLIRAKSLKIQCCFNCVDCYRDAFDGTPEPVFDELYWNWLGAEDRDKALSAIRRDMPKFSPEEREFYEAFLNWFDEALLLSNIIIAESNL